MYSTMRILLMLRSWSRRGKCLNDMSITSHPWWKQGTESWPRSRRTGHIATRPKIWRCSLSRALSLATFFWRVKSLITSITVWCKTISILKATHNGFTSEYRIRLQITLSNSTFKIIRRVILCLTMEWKLQFTRNLKLPGNSKDGIKAAQIFNTSRIVYASAMCRQSFFIRPPSPTLSTTIMTRCFSRTLSPITWLIWEMICRWLIKIHSGANLRNKTYCVKLCRGLICP